MPDVAYRQIAELTDAEIEAARAYGAEFRLFPFSLSSRSQYGAR